MTFVDYYELLRIPPDADSATVSTAIRIQRQAWRRRARHPRAQTRLVAERVCDHLSDAADVLLQPGERCAYDQRREAAQDPAVEADRSDGWSQLAAGRAADARDIARATTAKYPADGAAWYLHGVASHVLGDMADAECALYEAIRHDPSEAAYHCELGDLYAHDGLAAAAQAAYRRASDLDPDNSYCRIALAALVCARGHAEVALPMLERVLREDPGDELASHHCAIAIAAVTIQLWSRQIDGRPCILNETQLDASRRNLRRIRELCPTDPEPGPAVGQLARAVTAAEQVRWHVSSDILLYIAGLLTGLTGVSVAVVLLGRGVPSAWLTGAFCLAAVIAIPVAFVSSHRVPGWRWDRAHSPEPVRRSGLQPARPPGRPDR